MPHYTEIIAKNKKDYDAIAQDFSQKRTVYRSLKRFKWIVDYLPSGNLNVLDIGCGNARMIDFFQQYNCNLNNYLGVDFSVKLIEIARANHPKFNFLVKDITQNNFVNNILSNNYNVILLLAVLHHLPSKKFQLKALRNIYQVLGNNGYLIVTVWNLWQKNFWLDHFRQLILKYRQKNLKFLYIPYKISDGLKIKKIIKRFFYSFTKLELKNLLNKAGFRIIDSFYTKHGNKSNFLIGHDLCLVAKKEIIY